MRHLKKKNRKMFSYGDFEKIHKYTKEGWNAAGCIYTVKKWCFWWLKKLGDNT